MKKQLLSVVAVAGALLLGSCTEKGPSIDFSTAKLIDTTYLLDVPEAPQPRVVFIEEATGVKCPNCPAGAKILRSVDSVNPGRLVIVALHANNQAEPIEGESKYDFRQDDLIVGPIFSTFNSGEPNKPSAMFDRTAQGTTFFVDSRGTWPNIISQRLATPSPVRLSVSSSYNSPTHEATITVRISYTAVVNKQQSVGILITEDGIVDAQEDGLTIIEDYDHEHVFRDYVTTQIGKSFLDTIASKEIGRVFERTFVYKLPDRAFGDAKVKWNLDNCNVVCFVSNNESGDNQVVQAIQRKLK